MYFREYYEVYYIETKETKETQFKISIKKKFKNCVLF